MIMDSFYFLVYNKTYIYLGLGTYLVVVLAHTMQYSYAAYSMHNFVDVIKKRTLFHNVHFL